MLLHVGDGLTGIGFVRASVQLFGHGAKLNHKIAGKVLGLDLTAFLAPKAQ